MPEHDKECEQQKVGNKKNCRCEINRYKKAVFITTGILLFQLVIIWFTDNLSLRADTFHVSSDLFVNIGSLIIAIVCLKIANSTGNLIRTSFAVAGIILLIGGGLNVIIEANDRLINPVNIGSWPVILAGIIGAAGNYWVHAILERVKEKDRNTTHNVLSAHVLSDMICSFVVAASAAIVFFTGWMRADPYMSIAIAGYIFFLSGQLVYKILGRGRRNRYLAILMVVTATVLVVLNWNLIDIYVLVGLMAIILFIAGFKFGYKHNCDHEAPPDNKSHDECGHGHNHG